MLRILIASAMLTIALAAEAAAPAPIGADHGMVVSAQRLASEVGVDILKQGGNAVDAAVATGYALAVVWPAAGNLGGGGFMSLRLADGRSMFVDFREKAPLAATETMFQDAQGHAVPKLSTSGWLAVGVPGSVAGLDYALTHFGTISRAAVMAPAIRLAREGFVLGPADVTILDLGVDDFRQDPATASIFLDHGKPYEVGARFVQPQLAATLEAVAAQGPVAFYQGDTAREIVKASTAGGGILGAKDLASYKVGELAPITCSYRGYDIQSAPPPSAGGIALCEALNILEGYDLRGLGYHSAASVHLLVEAMRRAFLDRQVLGDPAFVANPVALLTGKDYAARLRATIDPVRATPSAALGPTPADTEGRQTTHFSVADAEGNAVSVTTTLNDWFGNRRVAGTTGVLMNDEMDDFAAAPGASNMFGLLASRANVVAPGKTPVSSMSPTIVTRGGKLVMVIGSPGGSRIISTVLQAIIDTVDYDMTIEEAIDAPRLHQQWMPDVVDLEPRALSPDTRRILEGNGYVFKEQPPWSVAEGVLAGAPSLAATSAGISPLAIPPKPFALYGASDDRGPAGAAIGY
ncbi:MAG TPA: gamma-glutamyltransferase [Lichenihabitans sp.]|jgi:gamma-glutamyltranspeptidase/glutathione hydrolase|nr:gamma-glutamyltransferase [Lichenihabitans sp.]